MGRVILSEIFFMTFSFHLISVIPIQTGILGHDAHFDYYAAKTIMNNGWPIPQNVPVLARTRDYSEWPMLHFFGGTISTITGVDLFTVAKWLPLFYSPFAVLFVYLLAKIIYNDERTALLATFGISGVSGYIFSHAKFIREGFAYVLFFAALYTCVKGIKERKITFWLLGLIFAFSLVFSHHLSGFFLLLLLFIWYTFYHWDVLRLLKIRSGKPVKTEPLISRRYLSFAVLVLLFTISHWMFIGEWVIDVFVTIVNELSVAHAEATFVRYYGMGSPRVTMVSLGSLLLVLALSILVLNEIRKRDSRTEDLVFLFWNCLMFGLILIPRMEYTRFITYGYPLLLIAAASVKLEKKYQKIWYSLFAIVILLSVFSIPPHIYVHSINPEYESGEYRNYYLPQEYDAVYWSNLSGISIGDYRINTLFGGLRQLNVVYDERAWQVLSGDLEASKNFNWLIFDSEYLHVLLIGRASRYRMTNENYERLQWAVYLSKVYENNQVGIYHVCQP